MMLCDDFPEYCNGTTRAPTGPTPVTLQLNVKNSDAAIERMAKAGAKVTMPATDMFRGDHYGQVVDPSANDENTLAIRAVNDRVAADARLDSVIVPIGDGLTVCRKR